MSNVVEAHVDVVMLPVWRRAQCETPSGDSLPDRRSQEIAEARPSATEERSR